jgi:hypothetical protein
MSLQVLTAVSMKRSITWDVTSCRNSPMFRRTVLPPSTCKKNKPSYKPAISMLKAESPTSRFLLLSLFLVDLYRTTRHHIAEDSTVLKNNSFMYPFYCVHKGTG